MSNFHESGLLQFRGGLLIYHYNKTDDNVLYSYEKRFLHFYDFLEIGMKGQTNDGNREKTSRKALLALNVNTDNETDGEVGVCRDDAGQP